MVRSASARRLAFVAASILAVLVACSDSQPPPIGDSDGGPNNKTDVATIPCSTPATGCPCDDAGAKYDCGKVYRISGNHIDCSEGYLTCESGKWGACIGASVYDGG